MSRTVRSLAPTVGRRRLLVGGAGAAAVAADAVLTAHPAAAHPSVSPPGLDVSRSTAHVVEDAGTADPISGLVYRTACMYDFFPFAATGQRQWGGQGVYSAVTAGAMRATVAPPPGAKLEDVVFHVYNNSGSTAHGDVLKFTAGNGSLTQLGTAAIPSAQTMSTVRVALSDAQSGPYPVGTVLLASVTTPTDGKVQVNAARFGFARGAGAIGLLPTPIRVYDSRTIRKLRKGSTRTITLPASAIPPGTTGVLLNVTAADPAKPGYLKVYPGNASAPASSALNFDDRAIANALTVGISADRRIKVYASRSVHVVLDLTGTVA